MGRRGCRCRHRKDHRGWKLDGEQQIGTLILGRARQPLVVGAGDVIDLTTDFTAVDFA
ncbi:MAG: hypothetical protein ABI680_20415 [Chthoniobacteraceae bacterium]